jgi:hypothetical protein
MLIPRVLVVPRVRSRKGRSIGLCDAEMSIEGSHPLMVNSETSLLGPKHASDNLVHQATSYVAAVLHDGK